MYRYFFKRVFDILGALILIILTLPVMIWAYFAIKKHLGSPVIFTQSRPGKDEKIFKIYKFRSMSDARD
ncbi:MAG: undecaprenyl phosphate N,N'-diacetylbacillosamine 1-phosphate transferase, partial [Campylobacter sp.]|nr:undecaprenyl phosphate N,N'-diacetylbacillosamine 1-phosphate transferase [Campylobacter sp.]